MILSVASGKGGTGKTSVAVNLALSLGNAQLLDCDVEEPNVYLYLHPAKVEEEPICSLIPSVDEGICNLCGKCAEVASTMQSLSGGRRCWSSLASATAAAGAPSCAQRGQ